MCRYLCTQVYEYLEEVMQTSQLVFVLLAPHDWWEYIDVLRTYFELDKPKMMPFVLLCTRASSSCVVTLILLLRTQCEAFSWSSLFVLRTIELIFWLCDVLAHYNCNPPLLQLRVTVMKHQGLGSDLILEWTLRRLNMQNNTILRCGLILFDYPGWALIIHRGSRYKTNR